ncbi:hypothetical protein F0562_035675 [Nyssa sinensis]|uniref:RING-type E3 ubiquitin transferase n=1 Tax=Nyssa sinensis TaxID=561372 RepID=A0A5J5ACK3_9ASTE|nr:hypothetical protein F0562_035675 [Nyssa sinensis]
MSNTIYFSRAVSSLLRSHCYQRFTGHLLQLMKKNSIFLIIRVFGFYHGTNWVVVTLPLYFAPVVTAQTGTVPPPPAVYQLDTKTTVSPSMAIILVCLISVFFLMGFFVVYVRRCADRHLAQSFTLAADGFGSGRRWRRAAPRGLDPVIIDSFPTFIYSQVKGLKIGKGALECAVCLNEFDDDESLRLLPKCCHVFHPSCIDAWLLSHITCPVCRANLVPKPGELGSITVLSRDEDRESGLSSFLRDRHETGDLIIDIQSPDVMNPSQTPNNQNRPRRLTPTKTQITGKFPRSHSTGHSLIQLGEDCERFTLRLPEEVWNRLVSPSLSGTKSNMGFARARSLREGYRERNRFDRERPLDRWAFMKTPPFISRTSSAASQKVVVGDEMTGTSKSCLKSVKSPFDRLFGGTDKNKDNDNIEERSFDRLRLDDQFMGHRGKNLRDLIGILKDKVSLIKAALKTERTTSSIHVAVLRATAHFSSSPPPECRIAAILSLGNGSRLTSCACIEAIMDRLHNSRNACVALKSLITLHNIITRGSFILRDQLSFYPSAGGRNFLNLSRFRDDTDVETWELSSWVRWYANILEFNLMTSRVLGSFFSSSSIKSERDKDNMLSSLNSDLFREIDALVGMVKEICAAPESFHYQQNSLVYEVIRLVGEDYLSTQFQILIRLSEFVDRMGELSNSELAELTCCLEKLEDCREKLEELFVNRKRNDAFWDLIDQTKMKLVKVREERERKRLLARMARKIEGSESTQFGERVVGPGQLLRLPYGSSWLSVDRIHLTVSTATA